ncbi:hypothetical protein V6N13_077388 [Hibiscus sabdariffa]
MGGCVWSRGVHKATSRWPCSASISMHVRISSYGRVSVEVGNKWREDPRCSKHRQLTSEFGQSFEEPIDDPYDEPNFDRSRGWPSSWDSVEEQPSFGNVWNSVEEQPPMYGGGSSSQPAYTDDGGYIPQMDYTSITGSSYHPEQMHGTPPSMQVDDQWFNDEQTPDQPRRIVRPPKRSKQNKATSRWPCGSHGSISFKQPAQVQPGHVQVALLPQLNPAIGFARCERVDPRPGHLETTPTEVRARGTLHQNPGANPPLQMAGYGAHGLANLNFHICSCASSASSLSPLVSYPKASSFRFSKCFPQLGPAHFCQWSEKRGRCKGKVVHASLFGVGAPEALVIGVVALMVFGPKGLAEVARNLGKTLREFQPTIRELQEVTREFKSTLEREITLDEKSSSTQSTPNSKIPHLNNSTPTPLSAASTEESSTKADPNGTPSMTEAYASEGYLKVTEEQPKASAPQQPDQTVSQSQLESENQTEDTPKETAATAMPPSQEPESES